MRKYIRTVIGILTLAIFLQMTTAFAVEKTEYSYTVSGYSLSHLAGQPVAVNVFYPEKSAEDLKSSLEEEVLVYHGQLLTEENGFFEVTFSAPRKGEYTANVRCMGENEVRILSAYETKPKYTGTPVFSMNFDEIPSDLSIIGSAQKVFTDDEHGYSLACTPVSGKDVQVWKNLETPLMEGVYLLEYDTLFTRTDNYSYLRLSNTKNERSKRNCLFENVVFNDSSVLGYFNECRGFNTIPYETYEKDRWYNVKVWLDFDRCRVSYYIDSHFMGETLMHTDMMNRIYGFGFIMEKNTGGVQYIDNLSLKAAEYSLVKSLEKEEVPEAFLNSIKISASNRVTGNIYFSPNEEFFWNLENISDYGENINITYELLNTDGNCVMMKRDTAYISAETKKEQSVSLNFEKFGLYKMRITVENGNVYAQKSLNLSYIHQSDNLSGMGICTHFGQDKGGVEEIMPLIEKMGVGFVRDEAYWSEFEKTKGVYKLPEKYKEFVDEANSRGIEILQLLTYSNSLYGSLSPWEDDNVLKGFEEYCYRLALELKGKVSYFEVWNEYDLNGPSGVAGYVKLLKAGYNGVKRGNPDAIVVATTPKDVGTSWMDTVFTALNGERYMDIVAIHPYNEFIPESNNASWGYVGKFNIAHTKMQRYGYGDLPIWATELGWPSNDFPLQAAYTVRLNLLNTAHNANHKMMDKMFFYDMQNDGINAGYTEHNYGMLEAWKGVDVPYAAKEAYLATANYNAILGGATLVSYDEKSNGDYVYKFLTEKGKTIYALWNINGTSKKISIPVTEASAVVYDFYGNSQTVTAKNNAISVNIDGSPVYLKLGAKEQELYMRYKGKTVQKLADIPNGGKISAVAENAPEGAMLFAAEYEEGRLIRIQTVSGQGRLSLTIEKKNDCDRIKAFLWKDGTSLVRNEELIGESL